MDRCGRSSPHSGGGPSGRSNSTRELNENVYLDLDAQGNLVSLTIEHAREQANLPEMLFSHAA